MRSLKTVNHVAQLSQNLRSWPWRHIFPFRGSYNYLHVIHIGNENDWSIQGEWLVSEQTPVSIFAGYENSDFSGTGHVNTWFIGVKLYTNPNGPAPLVDRQRNGAATWGTQFAPLGFSLL